ncbi:hypothetical protein [Virgibacillus siamensis]|uniref:hypothetical protein n=1 Tax=Virgibacillus siamensis TaxID=480071 RepID=UPI000985208D|nr:hypothetical protein [Virgibacillus siamensis]
MPSKAYYELLHMLDPEELAKGNRLHIEIAKRMAGELKGEIYWKHPDEKPFREMTREEQIEALRKIVRD